MNNNVLVKFEDDWRIQYRNDGTDYHNLLKKFLAKEIDNVEILSISTNKRKVYKVEYNGRKFVIKHDAEKEYRWEKRLWHFFVGTQYLRLLRFTNKAVHDGCKVAQEVYLVAEKMISRNFFAEAWIIAEYIDGVTCSEAYKCAGTPKDKQNCLCNIAKTLTELHKYGIASNDVHLGNFIIDEFSNTRVIDLSVNGFISTCQAKDIVSTKELFNIDIPARNFLTKMAVALILVRKKLRNIIKRIKTLTKT